MTQNNTDPKPQQPEKAFPRIAGDLFDDNQVERTSHPETNLELAAIALQGMQIERPAATPYQYDVTSDKPPIRNLDDVMRRHQELGLPVDEGRPFTPQPTSARPAPTQSRERRRPSVDDDDDFSDRTYLR